MSVRFLRPHPCLAPLRAGLAAAALLVAAWAGAQSNPDELKAEVTYRALMFVTWPADRVAARGLQLCTLSEGRTEAALGALSGRTIRQQVMEVRRVRHDQLAGCHAVYLPGHQPAAMAALEGRPVLIVADAPGMLEQGAMVNLQVEDGRIVFDVDLNAARRAGLDISAKLLRLARYVKHTAG